MGLQRLASKMAEVAVLSALCVLCSTGFGLVQARHAPRVRGLSIRRVHAPAAHAGLVYGPPLRPRPQIIPDFTVQYGYVSNPGMASGSFGAMLQGRNPAAGAIP